MILDQPGAPLRLAEVPVPWPGPGEVLLKVAACGVCRTDLHVVDGELAEPRLPLIPGHQVVGQVVALGAGVKGVRPGDRLGVPWLGGSCGECQHCLAGRENLCDRAVYTGYQRDGGFAEFCCADARFTFPIPPGYPDLQAAPLLCAGLIGYRSLRLAGEALEPAAGASGTARRLGLYGFGAAAHIVAQVARWRGCQVFAFTRPGDAAAQAFAQGLGAAWVGGSDQRPPQELDAAIIFAPDGALVPLALAAVRKGGLVVCGGIHMSDVPSFPYSRLWGERVLRSVANLTRRDGEEFLALAPRVPVRTEVHPYRLERANLALDDLRHGRFTGAAVIVPGPPTE
jgi:propanol-preferring alcohol dehydrogenase